MNPAEIFIIGLSRNVSYFIPLILDYVRPNDHERKTGHHFRVPFVKENGYVSVVEVPTELLHIYLPFQEVFYDGESVKAKKIGEEKLLSFTLGKELNKPQKISQFPELSAYFKSSLKEFYHEEIDRQWVVKVSIGEEIYYFPSTILGTFFCFLSHKFTTNLFSSSLSREVEGYGKNPPFIQLKPGYSNKYPEVISLYLYSTNPEAKENYDRVGRRYITKQTYNRGKSKLRYAFKFPFPSSGEWELKARVVPVTDKSSFVAEIFHVNTLKLLKTEFVELRIRGSRKGERLLFSSPSSVKSKTEKVYDVFKYADSKEYPETVNVQFSSPPADVSVKIVKKVIYDDYVRSSPIPIPQKRNETKGLSNVEGHSEEGDTKRIRSTVTEKATRDTESRVFDLEIVKKLMEQVAASFGVKLEYREFVPKIPIKVSKGKLYQLYYPNGNKRKVGIFYLNLPSGKKMTAIFTDQKFQKEYIKSPILIGERKLEFPKEVVYFFKVFMEIERKNFKSFCKKRGFDVHFKKPVQGSSRKDWENWVERMVEILKHYE